MIDEFEHLSNLGKCVDMLKEIIQGAYDDGAPQIEPLVAIYFLHEGEGKLMIIPIGGFFHSDEGKAHAKRFIENFMKSFQYPILYTVFASEIWLTEHKLDVDVPFEEIKNMLNKMNISRPSESPNKVEKLFMIIEGEKFQDGRIFDINRDNGSPKLLLNDKMKLSGSDGAKFAGEFTGLLYKG